MAYILLVLGAVMSLVGLAAMITGYPAIEIERGWATVITGAVLLSGGLVVVGLGLVVRNLVGLRIALVPVGTRFPVDEASVPQPDVVTAALVPAMPPAPAVSALPERPSVSHPLAPAAPALAAAVSPAAAILAAGAAYGQETQDAPHPAEPESFPHETPIFDEPQAEPQHAETPYAEDDHHSQPSLPEARWPRADAAVVRMPGADVPETLRGERVFEPTDVRDGDHEAPRHAPVDDTQDEADRLRSNQDLLDEAFSAFDYEMANGHPPAAEATSTSAREHDGRLAVHATHAPYDRDTQGPADETEPHDTEPHDTELHEAELHRAEPHETEPHAGDLHAAAPEPEAPATAPAEPAANLAVIGRYDSEGTSYVMYSDGSIEAQSEAGVYRFNSMAELKAFIES